MIPPSQPNQSISSSALGIHPGNPENQQNLNNSHLRFTLPQVWRTLHLNSIGTIHPHIPTSSDKEPTRFGARFHPPPPLPDFLHTRPPSPTSAPARCGPALLLEPGLPSPFARDLGAAAPRGRRKRAVCGTLGPRTRP